MTLLRASPTTSFIMCSAVALVGLTSVGCQSESPAKSGSSISTGAAGLMDDGVSCVALGATDAYDGLGTARACVFDDYAAPRSFRLRVTPSDLAWLEDHALQETYVPGTLIFGGVEVAVEIRFKGGDSTLFGCFDEAGTLTCPRLSIKVRIADGKRFLGLRRLIFNASVRDKTYLRERLSYRLFREVGVAAPRAVHAWVQLGQRAPALFVLVEDVDRPFLNTRFAHASGNLTKRVWFSSLSTSRLLDGLVEGNPNDLQRFLTFAQLLQDLHALHANNDAAFGAAFVEQTATWVDLDKLAAYLAVDMFTNNWDGARGFYCGHDPTPDTQCRPHNFYVYDDPGSKRLQLIPWDLDLTFGRVDMDLGRTWSVSPTCTPYLFRGHSLMKPARCDPMWRGLMRVRWSTYIAALQQLSAAGSVLDPDRVRAHLNRYRAMIGPLVLLDQTAPTYSQWEAQVATLGAVISGQAEQVVSLLKHDFGP